MKKYYEVKFESTLDGSSTSIKLYSHFTCIYGKDSGEGKSYFYDVIEEGISTGSIKVTVDDKNVSFTTATGGSLDAVLSSPTKLVILMDEIAMVNPDNVGKINNSKHMFIGVARAMPFKSEYPLFGMYKVVCNKNSGIEFDLVPVERLPLAKDFKYEYDNIVVEASKGRSEHELLSNYLDDVIPCGGRDRIKDTIRVLKGRTLVFADLGNIGRAYGILLKRTKGGNISFYPYISFEQLIYNSSLVRGVVKSRCSLSPFDVFSLEKYYEKILEEETRGTELEYKHGKKLKDGYFDIRVFDSKAGRGILEYIKRFGKGRK